MNYKEIIQNVLTNGKSKSPTRIVDGKTVPVENNTIGTFCEIFRHDMSKGFPLTTLRKMPWKSIRIELEGFINGITDKRWYQVRGCKFWDEWANPEIVKEKFKDHMITKSPNDDYYQMYKHIQKTENDLGPIYGYQWRNFGGQYGEVSTEDFIEGGCCPATGEYQQIYHNINGIGYFTSEKGYDQLQSIVNKLNTSPHDRRMICSAWNPNQEHLMALPPCHYSWGVVVYGDTINLHWNQRSCDLMLGVGANIASYALLLLLLAKESGLTPGELVGKLEDCHIYENHMDAAREIIKRDENKLPEVKIKSKQDGAFDIFSWNFSDVELIDYNPHPPIDVGKVTV